MPLYKELNILEDKRLFYSINLLSLILLFGCGLLIIGGYLVFGQNLSINVSIFTLLWMMVIFLLSLPVHEWFHGIFFKLFSEEKHVTYGFMKGMLYASNPGVIYTKKQFFIIAFAPFVLNSCLFYALSFIGMDAGVLWVVFILHTSGCAGDFWYVYELIKKPAITHCEDTPQGIKLFTE